MVRTVMIQLVRECWDIFLGGGYKPKDYYWWQGERGFNQIMTDSGEGIEKKVKDNHQ